MCPECIDMSGQAICSVLSLVTLSFMKGSHTATLSWMIRFIHKWCQNAFFQQVVTK